MSGFVSQSVSQLVRFLVAEQLYKQVRVFVCGSVGLRVCLYTKFSLSKRPSSICLIHFGGKSVAARGQKETFGGSRPSMEDDLIWKTTFDGRRPLTEDDL